MYASPAPAVREGRSLWCSALHQQRPVRPVQARGQGPGSRSRSPSADGVDLLSIWVLGLFFRRNCLFILLSETRSC